MIKRLVGPSLAMAVFGYLAVHDNARVWEALNASDYDARPAFAAAVALTAVLMLSALLIYYAWDKLSILVRRAIALAYVTWVLLFIPAILVTHGAHGFDRFYEPPNELRTWWFVFLVTHQTLVWIAIFIAIPVTVIAFWRERSRRPQAAEPPS